MHILKLSKSNLSNIKSYLRDYINWKKLLANLNWQNLENDSWFLICPYGIGDTYFACALLKSFLFHHGATKAIIAVKKSHLGVANLFADDIYKLVTIDKFNYFDIMAIQRFSNFRCGHPFGAHPSLLKYDLDRVLGTEGFTLLDIYKKMLQLAVNTPLTQPKTNPASFNSAKEKFLALSLPPGKTVILASDANSLSTLSLEFWWRLSERLKLQGWTVCNNTCKDSTYIPGTIRLDFSLSEAIPIAEIAGWLISSRSGLCDLLSSAKCKLSVIYMKQKWFAGTALTGSSLKRMGLSETVLEYEVSEDQSIDTLISKIVTD